MSPRSTRRSFLGNSALAASAALAAESLKARASTAQVIRLGGPVFLKSSDPEELAREHRRLGYSAAYCPDVTLNDRERIAPSRKRSPRRTSSSPRWAPGKTCSTRTPRNVALISPT